MILGEMPHPRRPSASSELDDALELARESGTVGFTMLYRLLAAEIAAFSRARGVRDVDDLVNEVFLGAFRGLGNFSGSGADFRAYVYRITRNKIFDLRAKARSSLEQLEETPHHGAPADAGDGADAHALDRLDRQTVLRLVSQLTEEQQEVILLRFLADLTVPEVARVTGRSESAVKALQRRSLASLRRRISDEGSIDFVPSTDSSG